MICHVIITVIVCGDGSCQEDYGESCKPCRSDASMRACDNIFMFAGDSCSVDCCVFPPWAIALIVIVCVCVPVVGLIAAVVVRMMYNKIRHSASYIIIMHGLIHVLLYYTRGLIHAQFQVSLFTTT